MADRKLSGRLIWFGTLVALVATPARAAGPEKDPEPTAAAKKSGADEKPSKTSHSGTAKAATEEKGMPQVVLPSLTTQALCDELHRGSQSQENSDAHKMDSDRDDLIKERAKLEKLQQEVARAREALKTETARLEELTRWAATKDGKKVIDLRNALSDKAQIASLGKMLRSVKPDKAAVMVAHLARPLAVEVLRSMKPNDVALVMEHVKPELAAELITAIATTPPKEARR